MVMYLMLITPEKQNYLAIQKYRQLQQQNKQSNEERRKAAERAEREERRARLGIEIEKNDSQVGDRRFARGRAYEADRFKNRKQDAENNTNVNED